MPQLKPLQEFMLAETRKAFATSKRIILQAATGSGKTIISAQIIKNALDKGKRIIFIADRVVLVQQTSDVFQFYNIPHGVIMAQNDRFDLRQPCQVCSIATLKRRGTPSADLYIIDECHVLYAAHQQIMKDNPDAYFLGLSATPFSRGLGKWFDKHIQPVSMKDLIKEGYLVPFTIYGPTVADLSKLKVAAGEYTEESLSEAYDKADIISDVVKTWQRLANGKKTIIFVVNVAHGKHLVERFRSIGVSAAEVNYRLNAEEKKEELQKFAYDRTTVLCSTEMLTRGFDSPSIEVCMMAVATRSHIKWIQSTGRALRTADGKTEAMIIDLGGNAARLGFPDDYEMDALDDGKKKKKAETEYKPKLPRVCPSCAFIIPVGVRTCPACGHTPNFVKEVDVADGELKKLQRKAKKEYTIEQKQSFLAQLNTYAASKGMKMGKGGCFGWCLHQYSSKFGSQPSGKVNWGAREPIGPEVQKWITYTNIKYAYGKAKREGK